VLRLRLVTFAQKGIIMQDDGEEGEPRLAPPVDAVNKLFS
jgi:hypothetical protein